MAAGSDGASYRRTPLHVAVLNGGGETLSALLESPSCRPALDAKDSDGQTPLSLALSRGMPEAAVELLRGGASVDVADAEGRTLLHRAISSADAEGALFLLNNGADIDVRTGEGETPLSLAIEGNLPSVVECLCRRGADLSAAASNNNKDPFAPPDPPLWRALQQGEDLASILVRHGVDTDGWGEGPDGCQQTLLHRCIDENLQVNYHTNTVRPFKKIRNEYLGLGLLPGPLRMRREQPPSPRPRRRRRGRGQRPRLPAPPMLPVGAAGGRGHPHRARG